MNDVIVIAGPTATGKTALSVRLAKEIGGEVISADSVQIYKKLNIGSAKPTPTEMQGVPHHMMDMLAPSESFSVADFCVRANEMIAHILSKGCVPIVTGGTGLYITSLVDNISFVKEETDPAIRARLMREAEQIGNTAMYEKLKQIDPQAACAIHPNNVKRVVRALEVYYATGKTITEQNAASKLTPSPYRFILCALSCERECLYERINRRVDQMVQSGLFDEVASLLSGGVSADAQSMQGIGYKEVVQCLNGETTKEACIETIKQNSRRYAKRQLTWFRRGQYRWFDCTSPDLYESVRRYIGEYGI